MGAEQGRLGEKQTSGDLQNSILSPHFQQAFLMIIIFRKTLLKKFIQKRDLDDKNLFLNHLCKRKKYQTLVFLIPNMLLRMI
jgi:hypothetical protein